MLFMAKKGVEFQTETMMRLAFVLLVFFAIVIILTNIGGGIREIIARFCGSNPQLCGQGTTTTSQDQIAFESTRALACAINSVSAGKEQECMNEFKPASSIVNPESETRKAINIQCDTDKTFCERDCDTKCTELGCSKKELSCQQTTLPKVVYHYDCTCTLTVPTSTAVSCNEGASSCRVANFNLPENFGGITGNAREYIAGFGNPSYLVYFQNFPAGEDAAWSVQNNWWHRIASTVWVLPATNLLRPVFNVGKGLVRLAYSPATKTASVLTGGATTSAANYAKRLVEKTIAVVKGAPRLAEREIIYLVDKSLTRFEVFKRIGNDKVAKHLANKFGDDLIINPGLVDDIIDLNKVQKAGLSERVVRDEIHALGAGLKSADELGFSALDVLRESEIKAALKLTDEQLRGINRAILRTTEVGIVTGTFTDYLAQRDLCEKEKYDSEGKEGELVLQKPLICKKDQLVPFTINIDKLESGENGNKYEVIKPFVLYKGFNGLGFGNSPAPLYFASPCYAHLEVTKADFECAIYEYEGADNTVQCLDPIITTSSSAPSCGFDETYYNGARPFGGDTEVVYKEGLLYSNDRAFVEYNLDSYSPETNPLGRINTIIDQFKTEVSYRNMMKLDDCTPLEVPGFGSIIGETTKCYSYDIYKNSQNSGEKSNILCQSASESISYGFFLAEYYLSDLDEEDKNNIEVCMNRITTESSFLVDKNDGKIVALSQTFRQDFNSIGPTGTILTVILLDTGKDGSWDNVVYDEDLPSPEFKRIVSLSDRKPDGSYGHILSAGSEGGCKIPGYIVKAEKSNDIEPNFCYQSKDVAKQVTFGGVIATSFVIDQYFTRGFFTKVGVIAAQGLLAWWASETLNQWPEG